MHFNPVASEGGKRFADKRKKKQTVRTCEKRSNERENEEEGRGSRWATLQECWAGNIGKERRVLQGRQWLYQVSTKEKTAGDSTGTNKPD